MIDISSGSKAQFLKDSTRKDMTINVDNNITDISKTNFYFGDVGEAGYEIDCDYTSTSTIGIPIYCNSNPQSDVLSDFCNVGLINDYSYAYFSFEFQLSEYTDFEVENMWPYIRFQRKNSSSVYNVNDYRYVTSIHTEIANKQPIRMCVRFNVRNLIDENVDFKKPFILRMSLYSSNSQTNVLKGKIKISKMQFLFSDEALSITSYKTYQYVGKYNPSIFGGTITNENLEEEAFSLTESLCSGDDLKFGACEASYCEFTTVNTNIPMKDRYIHPYVSIGDMTDSFKKNLEDLNWYNGSQYSSGAERYNPRSEQVYDYSSFNSDISWSMGTDENAFAGVFDIDYNQYAKYLSIDCDIKLEVTSTDLIPDQIYVYFNLIPDGYTQGAYVNEKYKKINYSDITSDYVHFRSDFPLFKETSSSKTFSATNKISKLSYRFYDANGNTYPSGSKIHYKFKIKNIQIRFTQNPDEAYPDFDPEMCYSYYRKDVDEYLYKDSPRVPLGRFKVTGVKKNHSQDVKKISITAYDDLIKLNQNAGDWYTLYMYARSSDQASKMLGYEFTRQIFSSYWNIISTLGIDKRSNYIENVITETTSIPVSDKTFSWTDKSLTLVYTILTYGKISINIQDSYKGHPMAVDVGHSHDETWYANVSAYREYVDPYLRGMYQNSEIMIQENLSNYGTNRFLVDNGDYFMISDDCESLDIYIPLRLTARDNPNNYIQLANSIKVSSSSYYVDLTNASTRLVYYNYATKEIFDCDSGITARDVVRSLLEVTGCFFKLDRYGKPQFRYCTKSALYPSDTLYPSNTLYPRGLDGDILPMHKYKSAECEDYEVKDYGKIQILKKQTSNEAKSICQWEYVGDEDAENTYIIDDNIFYCNSNMEYDYDNMFEVAQMLENMYNRISNMGYVPNTTQAIGAPYVEVGDRIGLITKTGGFESFIFRRTMKGIQNLSDTYESKGSEYTDSVSDYGYKVWED